MLNKSGAVASGIGESGKPPVKREPVLGDTGLHGIKDSIVVAKLAVTLTDRDDVNLTDLAAIKGDGTVIMKAAQGGKVYTMAGAYCAGDLTLTAGEGETKVEFFGEKWVETVSAV